MNTGRIMMNRISHVAIVVKDLPRSLKFYQDILGFELDGDILTVDDADADALNGISRGKGKHWAALMHCGKEEKAHLDLLCFEQPTGEQAVPSNHIGLTHVGFWVDNMSDFYDDLTGKGVQFTCPPITYEMEAYGGAIKVARFYDPDGTMIEVYGK
jgi:glyoxylase I family protein